MSITEPPPVDHPVLAATTGAQACLTPVCDPATDESWQLTDAGLLDAYGQAARLCAMADALRLRVLGELERRQVTWHEFGLDTASWLRSTCRQSSRTAKRDMTVAVGLAGRFGQASTALAAGDVSAEQIGVVVEVLDDLPPDLSTEQVQAAESTMLGFTRTYDPVGLRRLARHVVEVVAPEIGDTLEAERLAREEAEAHRTRYLRWGLDGHGSLYLTGKLPVVDGEALRAVVDAIASADHAEDPDTGERGLLEHRRADALVAITSAYARSGAAPCHGGDRPRVAVMLDYTTLLDGLGAVTMIDPGEAITAGDARRLACDAGILPVILGGDSQPLDVGREQRLFTGGLRAALVARDGGCVFPGCDRPPRVCDAHHIVPWWAGGRTSLDNGVLLCPRHHRLIEPDPWIPELERWHMRMGGDGYPDTVPPAHLDLSRTPRRHHRHPQRQ